MRGEFLQRETGGAKRLAPVLEAFTFPGPVGPLEGLWKPSEARAAGSAVFAHPHPLHGGTLHSKVVYRCAKALTRVGYGTLRFNFRGVGLSAGRFDDGAGEILDFRSAEDEAERRGGLPLVAGGFSFGAAVALRAIDGDTRVAAYVGVGLPLATSSGRQLPRPRVPALFVVGENDRFGPPEQLRAFVGDAGEVVEIAAADHFLEGKLLLLEDTILRFLVDLRATGSVV